MYKGLLSSFVLMYRLSCYNNKVQSYSGSNQMKYISQLSAEAGGWARLVGSAPSQGLPETHVASAVLQ